MRVTYDAASRPTQIWNWDATIDNTYFDDNKLASQTETTGDCGDNTPRTVSYTYNADGNRGTMTYYVGYTYNYHYTNRNQLHDINYQNYPPMITYQYDKAGNRTLRAPYNGAITEYAPVDALNRSSWVRHTFSGGQTAQFDYGYDEMSRVKYEQRPGGAADGFSYDQVGQVVGTIRDGTLSNGTVSGTNLPLTYDGSGNRTNTWGIPYTANNLNQYATVGGASIISDANGNIQGRDGWTYVYDAQNRLRSAINGSTRLDFYYDGLNRQITRGINTGSGWDVTFSIWDGWNLLEERGLGNVLKRIYFWGAATDELVCAFGGQYATNWFTQDGRGNTSHISDDGNNLVERYTYGLSGEPQIWDPNGNPRPDAITANRFMFQGRDYLKEGAIYDYRNRFYLPSLGRFIQPDPLGFASDPNNLFRYCGNDPVNGSDPFGLQDQGGGNDHAHDYDWNDREVWLPNVDVHTTELPTDPFAHDTLELWRTTDPLADYNSRLSLQNDYRFDLATVPYTKDAFRQGSLPDDFTDHSEDLTPFQAALVGAILLAHGEYKGTLFARRLIGYRAVSAAEFRSISKTRAFRPAPSGTEVKYFFDGRGQAVSFGERMYGPGRYGLVRGEFPMSALGARINPATEGPAFVVPNANLSSGEPILLFPPRQ